MKPDQNSLSSDTNLDSLVGFYRDRFKLFFLKHLSGSQLNSSNVIG